MSAPDLTLLLNGASEAEAAHCAARARRRTAREVEVVVALADPKLTPGRRRNDALERASGRMLMFCHGVEPPDSSFLEHARRTLEREPSLDFVSAWFDSVPRAPDRPARTLGLPEVLSRPWFASVPTLFRPELWRRLGGFDESLLAFEDLDFWLRALESGAHGAAIEEPALSGTAWGGGLRFDDPAAEHEARRFFQRHAALFDAHWEAALIGKERVMRELVAIQKGHEDRARTLERELARLDAVLARAEPPVICHFWNPIAAPSDPELALGQSLAVKAMTRARERALASGIEVELVTAQFPEDRFLGAPFRPSEDLARSVADVGRFAEPRKLPLLSDLFGRALSASAAPIFVYTNADIVVAPELYCELARLFESLDACSILRRTVPGEHAGLEDPAELAELGRAHGLPHPGHDCIAFRREVLEGIDLGELCIGFPPFGLVLVALLSSLTQKGRFAVVDGPALTFHAGDARHWADDRYLDYWRHNKRAALSVLDRTARSHGLSDRAEEIRRYIEGREHL